MNSTHDLKAISQQTLLYFSALTGLSFAASAIVHEAVFATWGLDFAAIATPTDVIMGGFRILTIIIPIFLVLELFNSTQAVMSSTSGKFRNMGILRQAGRLLPFLLFALVFLFALVGPAESPKWVLSMGPYRVLAAVVLLAVVFFSTFVIGALGVPLTTLIEEAKYRLRRELAISGVVSIVALFALLSSTSYLNLSFANGAMKLPEACSRVTYNATGLGYKIRWFGSASIVLSCGDTWFVISNPVV